MVQIVAVEILAVGRSTLVHSYSISGKLATSIERLRLGQTQALALALGHWDWERFSCV